MCARRVGPGSLNTLPPLPSMELLGHSALRRQMHKTRGWGDKLAKSHLHPESPCTLALLHQLARGLRRVHGDCRKSKGRAATQPSAGIFTRTRRTRRTTGGGWCVSLENTCHSCHQALEGPGGLALVRTKRRCRVTHRPDNQKRKCVLRTGVTVDWE